MGGTSPSPGRYTFSPGTASHSPKEETAARDGSDSTGLPPRRGGASGPSPAASPPSNVGGAGAQSSQPSASAGGGGSQPAAGAGERGSQQPSSPLQYHPLAPIIQSRRQSIGSAQGGVSPPRAARQADDLELASPQSGGRKTVREWLSPGGGGDVDRFDPPVGGRASPAARATHSAVDQPGASPSSLGWSSPPPAPRSPQKRWY